jgi:threonine/homoserine/homoserine lactone efflux protein
MIDQTTLLTYLAVLTGFVFLPGPAVLLTLARSASSGPKVGIATGLGIATGDLAHTMMAVFGLSAILAASALLFSLIKYAGAAYLIYLGIRAIFEKTEIGSLMRSPAITATKAYRQAVIAEVSEFDRLCAGRRFDRSFFAAQCLHRPLAGQSGGRYLLRSGGPPRVAGALVQ